jgi:hypothetical protein
MINVPDGTTTISGHVSQSLKVLAVRSAAPADVAKAPITLMTAAANAGIPKRSRFIQSPWISGFCRCPFDYVHLFPLKERFAPILSFWQSRQGKNQNTDYSG